MKRSPRVSVIVTTLRRPQSLRVAIGSILSSHHDSFEVLLADQNPPGETLEQLGVLSGDPKLRRVETGSVGLSSAQNHCARFAQGDILLITDDDCEVSADWIANAEAAFARHPGAGVLLGNVLAAPHDSTAGFIPAVSRPSERVWASPWSKPELEVMGACMAVRRTAWDALGGFPPNVGPGVALNSGGDYDLVLRALLRGIPVLECPSVAVVHHGFRNWPQAQKLLENYAFGTALVLAMRTGTHPPLFLRSLVAYLRSYLEGRSTVVASTSRRHPQFQPRRIQSFLRGLARGLQMSLRAETRTNPA